MSNTKYVVDFDGTIVDFWMRYYRVFFDSIGVDNLCSLEEYIKIKKKVLKDEILAEQFNLTLPKDYFVKKRQKLEEKKYLTLDTLLIDVEAILDFFETKEAFILTKRRKPDNLFWELEKFGIGELKKNVIVLNPDGEKSKSEFLKEKFLPSNNLVVIGDSQEEIDTLKLQNTDVYIVKTGMLVSPIIESNRITILESFSDYLRKRG